MKKLILMIMVCIISTNLYAQIEMPKAETPQEKEFSCITIGILNGGGSLIGGDFEVLLTDRFGVQVGAGLVGFGAGLNYHLKPSIRSSFVSLQYWNQGIGETFSQNVMGLNYVHRGKKWFTFQIGLGAPLSEGPNYPDNIEQPPIMLMYSMGFYLVNK